MTQSGAQPVSWVAGGRSVMGAAHIHHGVPNQDAIDWWPPSEAGPCVALAIADGHGASVHFRSAVGAHIAVETATAVLADALSDPSWIRSADMTRARAFAHQILSRWRTKVRDHVSANPLESGTDTFTPYGATLIAAAASPHGAFLLQLGDGDLMLGTADGKTMRPLRDDEGMIGEQTYSLCQQNAETHMRMRIVTTNEADVDFIMLSTDGLGKSFPDDQALTNLTTGWRAAFAQSGLPATVDRLEAWLPEVSQNGSGDDITVGFMACSNVAAPSGASFPEGLPTPVRRTLMRTIPPQARPGVGLKSVTWLSLAIGAAFLMACVGAYWLR
jgi:serine/threonine protein phosphatase PrpC